MVNAEGILHSQIVACRRCVEAGFWVAAPPIVAGPANARLMVVGQAPGKIEASQTRRPFSGPAGKRLFRWFAEAGWSEDEFRSINYMTAITKCYPGPHPSGRGDRVASKAEQALCQPWLGAGVGAGTAASGGAGGRTCHRTLSCPGSTGRGGWAIVRPAG